MSQTYINENQKLEFLRSGFHQYLLINLDTHNQMDGHFPTSNVNVTLRLEDIGGGEGSSAWGINKLKQYINNTYDNILFTPASDFEILYRYEYYKGVYYIKTRPFEEQIVMHILPKGLRAADNNILLFKDETADYTEDNIIFSDYNFENNRIGTFFESFDLDDQMVERRPITAAPYPKFHKFGSDDIKKIYKKHTGNQWTKEDYRDSYCEYVFDISKWGKNMANIEIDTGYYYNNSSAIEETSDEPYAVHYTGIKDKTNTHTEDRCTLFDVNFDNISEKTNNITQMEYYIQDGIKKIRFPTTIKIFGDGFNNNHMNNVEKKIFHKKIKYYNDTIYIEEDCQFNLAEWDDPSI